MGGCTGPFLKLNGKSFHSAESQEGKREVTLCFRHSGRRSCCHVKKFVRVLPFWEPKRGKAFSEPFCGELVLLCAAVSSMSNQTPQLDDCLVNKCCATSKGKTSNQIVIYPHQSSGLTYDFHEERTEQKGGF